MMIEPSFLLWNPRLLFGRKIFHKVLIAKRYHHQEDIYNNITALFENIEHALVSAHSGTAGEH